MKEQEIVVGIILVITVFIDQLRRRRKGDLLKKISFSWIMAKKNSRLFGRNIERL